MESMGYTNPFPAVVFSACTDGADFRVAHSLSVFTIFAVSAPVSNPESSPLLHDGSMAPESASFRAIAAHFALFAATSLSISHWKSQQPDISNITMMISPMPTIDAIRRTITHLTCGVALILIDRHAPDCWRSQSGTDERCDDSEKKLSPRCFSPSRGRPNHFAGAKAHVKAHRRSHEIDTSFPRNSLVPTAVGSHRTVLHLSCQDFAYTSNDFSHKHHKTAGTCPTALYLRSFLFAIRCVLRRNMSDSHCGYYFPNCSLDRYFATSAIAIRPPSPTCSIESR